MICALCNTEVPPYYRGPIGHAPENVCFGCWCEHWSMMEMVMLAGGDWTTHDSALWLIAHGATQCAAAELVGLHRNTIGRLIGRIRRFPELMPEWVKEQ